MPRPLSNARLAKLLAGDRSKRTVIRDGSGLVLRIGARTAQWSYSYRVPGLALRTERTLTIGPVEAISLAEARNRIEKLKAAIAAGGDPGASRESRAALTLGALAASWSPSGRKGHVENEIRSVRLALAEMGRANAKPEAVMRADLAALMKLHAKRPATARLRLGALRRFFDHLHAIGTVEMNPVAVLPRKLLPPPPTSRSGYPTAAEARALWEAASRLSTAHGAFLRALILLPLRRSELAELCASEIDLGRREIVLSATRTKSARVFTMPLSEAALSILRPLLDGLAPGDRVFKLAGGGSLPMSAWSKYTKRVRALSGAERFILHDARRLFASEASEHDLADEVTIDLSLNHAGSATRSGVLAVYNRSSKMQARRELLEAWGRLVMHAVETGSWPRETPTPADNVARLREPA